MVGQRIKELRQAHGLSLLELSKKSGVIISSLSRIETGKMTGTVESHAAIAKALGVRLIELYAGLDSQSPSTELRQAHEAAEKQIQARGALIEPLVASPLERKMLPALVTLSAGKSTKPERSQAGCEKLVYLLKGQLQVTVGEENFKLKPGDSLYFEAALMHSFSNIGQGITSALVASCPPSL
jgi:transcriptional regulator with XRE-family HTH domain